MSLSHLLTPEGLALLNALPPYDQAQAGELQKRLRARGHSPELVAAALTQSRLRGQAAAKFGPFAARMLFTAAGLEQATRLVVAARHAARYREAGCRHVADLGCGIGADALALAGLGIEVTGVELDEETAALATFNLMPFGCARVIHGESLAWARTAPPVDAFFADPARRTAHARTFNPDAYSPPLGDLLELRHRRPLGVKVGPGIAHSYLPADAHAEWVSVGGEVVEAGLWFSGLAAGPGRSALVIDDGGSAHRLHVTDDPREPIEQVGLGTIGRYLLEPDGAVIRAGGVAHLAGQLGAWGLSEGLAYLSAAAAEPSPLFALFEVEEVFAYSQRRLREWAQSAGVGALEIKKRGVDVSPDALRKSLKLHGSRSATVILTRLSGKHSVVVARRLTERQGSAGDKERP